MKFNCGLTPEEKYKLKREKYQEKARAWVANRREKYGEWHRYFAWYPIRLGSKDCRWLEYVERRFDYKDRYQEYLDDLPEMIKDDPKKMEEIKAYAKEKSDYYMYWYYCLAWPFVWGYAWEYRAI